MYKCKLQPGAVYRFLVTNGDRSRTGLWFGSGSLRVSREREREREREMTTFPELP